MVLKEEDMNDASLLKCVHELWQERDKYISAMQSAPISSGVDMIIAEIEKTV